MGNCLTHVSNILHEPPKPHFLINSFLLAMNYLSARFCKLKNKKVLLPMNMLSLSRK
ncbi:hypothetical protein RchiOBHm_Chr5g0000931 [Rosa chinensis]|uniref:Uncharacterized protein n=1 Tax=Rosa chinensis TaxID=74649 RepID=A0A2P6Q221_ROSCH|nr:hypothetical protein RchiOBHm_Chr5g0000931 [Rosa chinensis]